MAREISLQEYLYDLSSTGTGISLETCVVEIRPDAVQLQAALYLGDLPLWTGEPEWVGIGDTYSVQSFTLNDYFQLVSERPININEEYHERN